MSINRASVSPFALGSPQPVQLSTPTRGKFPPFLQGFTQQPLFLETFEKPGGSMFNDGTGGMARRDTGIRFNGYPSCRLDTLGIVSGISTPGTVGPNTGGIVYKRRLSDVVSVSPFIFDWELWFRLTSNSWVGLGTGYFSISNYNRDGVNFYGARTWINCQTQPANIQILDNTGTWVTKIASFPMDDSLHPYDPIAGGVDYAGEWHYFRMITDFNNLRYLSIQLNDSFVDLTITNIPLRQLADAGPRALHFSVEAGANSATRRFLNIAMCKGSAWVPN